MNTAIKIFLFLMLFAFAIPSAYAQQNQYETKIVNGVEYLVYQVNSGEGLYSISKKFGVSQADINSANPQIHNGLKAGENILIPIIKSNTNKPSPTTQPKEPKNSISSDNNTQIEFVLHTVKRRQTLFAISRQYKVTEDAIIQANPQLKERKMQHREVLRIPVIKAQTGNAPMHNNANGTTANSMRKPNAAKEQMQTLHIGATENYITHHVAPKETLYSISRIYKVSVNDIRALNPNLEENLPIGTILKVPFASNNKPTSTTTSNNTKDYANNTKAITALRKPIQKNSYKIAFLLPFMADKPSIDPTVKKFIEFYFGALLAINNAKNGAINFEIYTFDTEKTENKIYNIINEPGMQEMDLIIGPAYTAQIPILADFAKRRKINTVIPFSSKAEYINSNPYVFQFNPDQVIQNEFISKIISNRYQYANILFVEDGHSSASEDNLYNYLIEQLSRQGISYNKIPATQATNVAPYLSSEKKNLIIYQSDDYKHVSTDLNKLNAMSSTYDIVVLGQYSWRSEKGKKPKMLYAVPFKGNSVATQFYEAEYKKYYGEMRSDTNPRWDLLGYDITTYFLSIMKKSGFAFNEQTQSLLFSNGVQSDFKFRRVSPNGGFVNHQMYIIEDVAN